MARFQNGWLRKKHRKSGQVWLFCYRQRRQMDGKWVEATPIRVGSLKEFPSEETAWRPVEELRLNPNQSTFGVSPQATFGQLAAHYMQHGLENSTLVEVRKVMNLVYKHGQRYGLLPRSEEGNPIHFVRQSSKSDFEPVILTCPRCSISSTIWI